jgi:hypothetical protein
MAAALAAGQPAGRQLTRSRRCGTLKLDIEQLDINASW